MIIRWHVSYTCMCGSGHVAAAQQQRHHHTRDQTLIATNQTVAWLRQRSVGFAWGNVRDRSVTRIPKNPSSRDQSVERVRSGEFETAAVRRRWRRKLTSRREAM